MLLMTVEYKKVFVFQKGESRPDRRIGRKILFHQKEPCRRDAYNIYIKNLGLCAYMCVQRLALECEEHKYFPRTWWLHIEKNRSHAP